MLTENIASPFCLPQARIQWTVKVTNILIMIPKPQYTLGWPKTQYNPTFLAYQQYYTFETNAWLPNKVYTKFLLWYTILSMNPLEGVILKLKKDLKQFQTRQLGKPTEAIFWMSVEGTERYLNLFYCHYNIHKITWLLPQDSSATFKCIIWIQNYSSTSEFKGHTIHETTDVTADKGLLDVESVYHFSLALYLRLNTFLCLTARYLHINKSGGTDEYSMNVWTWVQYICIRFSVLCL